MKKPLKLLCFLLISCLPSLNIKAADLTGVIEGTVIGIEPSKSIIIQIEKDRSIEMNISDIETLAIKDPKEITDNVKRDAAVVGIGSGLGASAGVVEPPKGLQSSRFKDILLVGSSMAAFSAVARITFNFLTQKPPMVIYHANNPGLSNQKTINNLSIGTKVRIVKKNYVNGILP